MRVLIVGSGGREHALAWALARSPSVTGIYAAPGNPGVDEVGESLPHLGVEDVDGLLAFARARSIDLTIVGPERPLIHQALIDRFRAAGFTAYGPTQAAARLEGSKAFTDEFLQRHGLSRKRFQVFDSPAPALAYLRRQDFPLVVKADGDAFGKGVKVCATLEEAEAWVDLCLVQQAFGPAGERIVIEECLVGPECSVQVFTDGETVLPMVPAQDYKRIGDGDTGPNTGGMGCYSPVPALDQETFDWILEHLVRPTVVHMAAEGSPVTGTLYAGCMLTAQGPELLEYNCRFGDPETQVVVPRLASDLGEILLAAATGRLREVSPRWTADRCVCVVVASGGYPDAYDKGLPLSGLEDAAQTGALVFHAGTRLDEGRLVTDGGRVLGVTGLGPTFAQARRVAYAGADKIAFPHRYFRTDIALRAEEAEATSCPSCACNPER